MYNTKTLYSKRLLPSNATKENSYATLSVLNIMDWAGNDAKPLLPTIQALKLKNYEEKMQLQLLAKHEYRGSEF